MREPAPLLSEEDLSRFRGLVRERTGMALSPASTPNLARAVRKAMATAGTDDVGTLWRHLYGQAHQARQGQEAHGGPAFQALVSALNVGETHFFRDQRQMQALEQRILPELIAARRDQRRLRIWSAGCSTGEEAYTLAILVDRLLPGRATWDVLILGTDLSDAALERAREATYGAWSLRGSSWLARSRYLVAREGRFEVAEDIRSMVTFSHLNLVEDVFPSLPTNTRAMDLVLCRNVLLYFGQDAARMVVRRLGDALADDGWLLVSHVEAGMPLFEGLRQEPSESAIYRKRRPALPEARADRRTPVAERRRAGQRPVRPSSAPTAPTAPAIQPSQPPEAAAAERSPVYEAALRLWSATLHEDALTLLQAEADRDPLAAPLHYLQGLILLDLARPDEALAAFRRCTCADPAFVAGHLAQAGLFARAGLRERARTALRNTVHLVAHRPLDDLVLEQEGLTVGDVLDVVNTQRRLLDPRRWEASRA